HPLGSQRRSARHSPRFAEIWIASLAPARLPYQFSTQTDAHALRPGVLPPLLPAPGLLAAGPFLPEDRPLPILGDGGRPLSNSVNVARRTSRATMAASVSMPLPGAPLRSAPATLVRWADNPSVVAVVFAFKAFLAGLLALYIAFWLELDDPK